MKVELREGNRCPLFRTFQNKLSRMSFSGGLRSVWMKSGHGPGVGQNRLKIDGRLLYMVPNLFFLQHSFNQVSRY